MDLLDEKSREPLSYPYEMVFQLQKAENESLSCFVYNILHPFVEIKL